VREPHDVHFAQSPFSNSHFGSGIIQRAQGTGMEADYLE
jgi:hypothetical protein